MLLNVSKWQHRQPTTQHTLNDTWEHSWPTAITCNGRHLTCCQQYHLLHRCRRCAGCWWGVCRGDQHDPAMVEYFLTHNLLAHFTQILLQRSNRRGNVAMRVQQRARRSSTIPGT